MKHNGKRLAFYLTIAAVCMFALLANQGALTPAPQHQLADSPWPMFRHDLEHTGRSPYMGAQTGTLQWKFKTGNWVRSSPVIAQDGTIYVGSYDNYIYAIKPDGRLKWKFKTGRGVNSSPAIGKDGTIYVSTDEKNLYAIKPNGKLKWRFEKIGVMHSSPAVGKDGTIYFGCEFYIYAIKPNGRLKWGFETGDNVGSSPAIARDGTIYVGSGDGYLYAIGGRLKR